MGNGRTLFTCVVVGSRFRRVSHPPAEIGSMIGYMQQRKPRHGATARVARVRDGTRSTATWPRQARDQRYLIRSLEQVDRHHEREKIG